MRGAVEPVIGLEVHVQLSTRTKLFCGCPSAFGGSPNTRICPVCTGQPGVLPVLNRAAVDGAVRTALALGGRVQGRSRFARKNYFYPDLPKGYQISQYEEPLARDGALVIDSDDRRKSIGIARIHLEEEAGKLTHPAGVTHSLVDFNRAGIPLVEIVTRPEIGSPGEALRFLQRLRQVLSYLGVSDVRMEEGSFRCDANVSVRPAGSSVLGVKTELKNMNSFHAIERALFWEFERQVSLREAGEPVRRDTLLWDEKRGEALVMRTKEEAEDYRYFPDPDLPPLVVDDTWIETIRDRMPELPWEKEERFSREYGIPEYDIGVLTAEADVADYFEAVLQENANPKIAANWVMGEVLARLKSEEIPISELNVPPHHMAELLALIHDGIIGTSLAKAVFREAADTGGAPKAIVEARGLSRIDDAGEIGRVVERILAANPEIVEKYRGGKESCVIF
jgi:aspartyl-tRNA(Asn)/glutamyl-tRNA(Gln) amidotransferase subunit B